MNPNGFRQLQVNLSGIGCWLVPLAIVWLLGAVGLGWIVKSLVVLVGLAVLVPVVLVVAGQFWLRRNLVQAACPVCSAPLTGLRSLTIQCPSCGTELTAVDGGFKRSSADGTIDVDVVDVPSVDVTVKSLPIENDED